VYVAFEDDSPTPGYGEIFIRKSTDGGNTWGANFRVTTNTGKSTNPAVAVNGSNVYVAFEDDSPTPGYGEIFIRKSADNGNTWGANFRVTTNTGKSTNPAVAVSGSNVYVAFEDDSPTPGYGEIFIRKSADNGNTWGANFRVTNNMGNSTNPAVAVSGSNVYVAFEDDSPTPGYGEIFIRKSADNGTNWGANFRVTNNMGNSTSPVVSASGNDVHVVFTDDSPTPGYGEIFTRKSTDNGNNWGANFRITNNTGNSSTPALN
jgi:imidazole glycerol phosphate synthase subunit HisF